MSPTVEFTYDIRSFIRHVTLNYFERVVSGEQCVYNALFTGIYMLIRCIIGNELVR